MTPDAAHRSHPGLSVGAHGRVAVHRALPEETPVAMVYGASTQAVMMASPADLNDFAIGFSLTEGIIGSAGEVESLDVVRHDGGVEVQMWLREDREAELSARRRFMAGPIGCGLCGIDSLDQANRALPRVTGGAVPSLASVLTATDDLRAHQTLHDRTHAVHAAGFLGADGTIVGAREDVGRHNALDKLIGAMTRSDATMEAGAIVLTSRVSVEMVQKAAMAGTPAIVAVSAPTAHAVRLAEGAGITLAAFAHGGTLDLFTHPDRFPSEDSHVA